MGAGRQPATGVPGGSGQVGPGGSAGVASRQGYRELRRSAAVVTGLVLAALLSVLDIAVLALLVAQPGLSRGPRGELLPAASSYALLAMVTLVAVAVAWRGSRGAAWTVLVVRILRVAAWGVWSFFVAVDGIFAAYALVSLLAVALLARGLLAADRTP
ncbi:hypothetical protein [Spirillospora sp. NPDC047279]|uniref:hypothetical protein n=1 Tax=Spirillospora sp. NPDC047279 TaxID=3155478 RepID=UPI00340423A6